MWGALIGGAASFVGGLMKGKTKSKATRQASSAQERAAQLAIDEQKRQFNKVQELMRPYVQAGEKALLEQQALLGFGEAGEQAQAIEKIKASSMFEELAEQGRDAILQEAAATGGLRGGNVQAALAQFQPNLLSQMINQQYNRLGGLTGMGQAGAAGTAASAQALGQNIAEQYGNIGSYQAGRALALGRNRLEQQDVLGEGFGGLLGSIGRF